MAVTISVSQVRQALYQAERSSSGTGGGSRSTSILGQWFHEAMAALAGKNQGLKPLQVLADLDADLDAWKTALAAKMYQGFIGPRISLEQAALHDLGNEVLDFWRAVEAASHWFAELTWSVRAATASRQHVVRPPWETLSDFTSTEETLVCEMREPGWVDSVRLVGIADAVIRLPQTGHWCGIEFKSGRTSPAADLGQACMYHLMLSAATAASGAGSASAEDGSLALISFCPQRHERLYSANDLANAKQHLIDLIGDLAGVAGNQPRKLSSAEPAVVGVCRSVNSLSNSPSMPSEEHLKLGQAIVTTLAEYGVTVVLDQPVRVGPAFLRFPVTLGSGMRVQAVESRAAELQVRLGLRAEPFIFRDEGQLVIDIQRPDRQVVLFHEISSQLPPVSGRGSSQLPVGVNLSGGLICADLAKPEHAHLLVAGTTGSGKSEWLRMALAGLLLRNTPETLRLVVIDPKRNAFHALRQSSFLWQPLVFPDEQSASEVLELLVEEMDRRYRLLDGADSIADVAWKTEVPIPRIVCVCDEYRDLISRDRQERKRIESQVCRLGAKARAAGIHLILATQEPSRETIKGPLDSNIPARVGLKMGKALESTMLLNEPGAERLLGHGDLLFKDIGKPRRLQAPLLTEANRLEIFGRHGTDP
jgi:hypothetical protein